MEEKYSATYIRANRDLGKIEMRGFKAENGSMNGQEADPKAYIEHIPQDWEKIDLSLYYSSGLKYNMQDTSIMIFVCP